MTLYLVGVDGGGTSCRARIRTQEGLLVGEAKSGSANILLGIQVAMSSIIESITEAAYSGGLSESVFPQMHIGLALAGAEQKSAWHEFMKQRHPFASMTLNTDAYGACVGAHNGETGAIMIAGTGSCGIFLENGKQHVVGGREFPISDQGSGAIMGLHLIQKTLLSEDDIGIKTPLSEHVMAHFNHDADCIVEWSKSALPCDYGQFSPAIFRYAQSGDELAISLLKQTACDIEMFLVALHKKGANQICLMGSIAERMKLWLSPPVQQWIVEPQFDAIEGALMYAGKKEHNLFKK